MPHHGQSPTNHTKGKKRTTCHPKITTTTKPTTTTTHQSPTSHHHPKTTTRSKNNNQPQMYLLEGERIFPPKPLTAQATRNIATATAPPRCPPKNKVGVGECHHPTKHNNQPTQEGREKRKLQK
eukprot:15332285-Ditylum_brightwellii.AAC.1